jgi:hypothetical protein
MQRETHSSLGVLVLSRTGAGKRHLASFFTTDPQVNGPFSFFDFECSHKRADFNSRRRPREKCVPSLMLESRKEKRNWPHLSTNTSKEQRLDLWHDCLFYIYICKFFHFSSRYFRERLMLFSCHLELDHLATKAPSFLRLVHYYSNRQDERGLLCWVCVLLQLLLHDVIVQL